MEPDSFPSNLLGLFLYLFPLRRRAVDEEVRMLHAVAQGRLLDVGCGSGEWLSLMKNQGWRVEGVDFDANAVRVARERGLDVHCGSLDEQRFPDDTFNAVTLNHVIEHIPDPLGTLTECARILKPGGRLILFTPNVSSLSHRVFKQHWRGLEPPRHLHLFSPQSMISLLKRASLQNVSLRPQIAESVIYDSVLLRRGRTGPFNAQRRNRTASAFAWLFNLAELCLIKWKPSVADCMAAIVEKE
jgi:SAM-dependent methyltransferase